MAWLHYQALFISSESSVGFGVMELDPLFLWLPALDITLIFILDSARINYPHHIHEYD